MSDLQLFNNPEFGQVRTTPKGNQIWFVAKDVAEILEYSYTSTATRRLDEDEKDVQQLQTPGGRQEMTIVNEYGLYNLVLGSEKEEAKQFKRWITHEVIPSIRKTGSYSVGDDQPPKPNNEFDVMRQMIDKIEEANKKAEEAKEEVAAVKETFAQIEGDWREYVNDVFSKIGQETGDYSSYRTESYIQLERRAGCNLSLRLSNMKDRKEQAGATKTEVEQTNKLDVIEADDKLKEIYINIVQEFEAEYL